MANYDLGEHMVCPLPIKIGSKSRVGPHNSDILSVITGSLLGDGHMEKHGNGSRLCFQQEFPHKSYMLWLHKFIADRGYTNTITPLTTSRIGNGGKMRYLLIFKTWTYASFNTMQAEFYIDKVKV
jgi:ubiquinol-cytochrome c reductase cytochrome b subunit